jgi:xylulokinase
VRHDEVVQPDPEAKRRYDEYYALYRQLYRDTAETVHRLARLGGR